MKKIAPNTYVLDDKELEAYALIKSGEAHTISTSVEYRRAVQRLVRNGLVENRGSRAWPTWSLSNKWKSRLFSAVSTIILPDGDNNRDPFLAIYDKRIEEAEELLKMLKEMRADYISRGERELKERRVDPQWRKHRD